MQILNLLPIPSHDVTCEMVLVVVHRDSTVSGPGCGSSGREGRG